MSQVDLLTRLDAEWLMPENKPPELKEAAAEIRRQTEYITAVEMVIINNAIAMLHQIGLSGGEAEDIVMGRKSLAENRT